MSESEFSIPLSCLRAHLDIKHAEGHSFRCCHVKKPSKNGALGENKKKKTKQARVFRLQINKLQGSSCCNGFTANGIHAHIDVRNV